MDSPDNIYSNLDFLGELVDFSGLVSSSNRLSLDW